MSSLEDDLVKRVNPRMFKSEPMQRCKLHECRGACCVFGVWVDQREMEDILANAALISPFMPEGCDNPGDWFASYEDHDEFSPSKLVVHTAVETRPEHYGGTACIFLRSDAKCALQVAGKENGFHPWRFKPYYCILHPLDLDNEGRITIDETSEMVHEEGSCLRNADQPIPLVDTFEEELRYLLGDKAYEKLKSQSDSTHE
jgi:Fe-S-cluster containining protein